MTDDKLYTSLSASTIMAKVTNHFQRTKLITSSTDKHYSLDSEDDFRSGCRNVSHQQQFFSELHSPGRSHYTNYQIECVCIPFLTFTYSGIMSFFGQEGHRPHPTPHKSEDAPTPIVIIIININLITSNSF